MVWFVFEIYTMLTSTTVAHDYKSHYKSFKMCVSDKQ